LTGSCEKRGWLATEGKRKSEGVLASAASVWLPRVERMAKEVQPGCQVAHPVFLTLAMWWPQSRPAAAAIAASAGRNRVRLVL
jgi:hypothetical protein